MGECGESAALCLVRDTIVHQVEQIYNTQIKLLPHNEQLRLVAIITHALVQGEEKQAGQKRSILELEGLGAEIWQGIDAQEYVNKLRDEWDEQP